MVADIWLRSQRFAQRIEKMLGPGRPLDDDLRRKMEHALGYKLDDVRIHDSRQAERMARYLGAEAFTIGNKIYGSKQSLDPLTPAGKGLVAHELTHVIQQTQPLPLSERSQSKPGHVISGETGKGKTSRFAGYTPPSADTTGKPVEAEAQAVERTIRRSAELKNRGAQKSKEIDSEMLAGKVYRLMKKDLMLQKEQA